MQCPVCGTGHRRSAICDRLRDAANSLELFAVPAFLTDPCNRIVWVNREFAAQVGDPVAEGVPPDDRFLPALLLGPYRERFPRGHIEVSQCVGALDPDGGRESLSLPKGRLLARVFSLYSHALAPEPNSDWDGTIVIRGPGRAMRLVREQVIPLADVHGVQNGFHISIWAPVGSAGASNDEPIRPSSAAKLTERQREIATLYAAGMSSRAVAERTGVSHRTARDHIEAAYARLGVHSRLELSASLLPK
jgi:DNA-binding CsgD family transcriptional regulator